MDQDTSRELAYPNGVGKFHKTPLGWRFIACSSSYTLRALSTWLTLTFKALMPAVHELWKAKMAEVGLRSEGCWIAKDSSRVPSIAVRLNRNFTKTQRGTMVLRTFDFSKMYTNIKLPELKEQMGKLMDWLFAFKSIANKTHLVVPRGKNAKAKWLRQGVEDNKKAKCFNAAKIKR